MLLCISQVYLRTAINKQVERIYLWQSFLIIYFLSTLIPLLLIFNDRTAVY
ncbi:MAG: hypothetical protein K0R21_1917 [Anaerocolumna sp.]|jgi:hypothetical protein|nr:hypothetical protein [Anaerocolumna sp.]